MAQTSCTLFGASNYVNSWLGINYVIIAAGFSIISVAYLISRALPGKTKSTITNFVWFEAVQLTLSVLIVVVLLGMSQLVCSTTAILGSSLMASMGVSLPGGSPFQYAQNYINNLALNKGLTLLDNIYTLSVQYAVESQLWSTAAGTFLPNLLSVAGLSSPSGVIQSLSGLYIPGLPQLQINIGYGLSILYNTLSTLYIDIFAPFTVIAIGMLIIQFIALPMLEAVAFTVILPVAITMRSLAFAGHKLREAANAVLSLAIAAYLVYPLTVVFSGYAMLWIFSSQNPLYSCTNCLNILFSASPTSITTSQVTGTYLSNYGGIFSTTPQVSSFLSTIFPTLPYSLFPFYVPPQALQLASNISLFMFQSIFLFAMGVTITIAFAMSLTRSLSTAFGGESQLFGSI